MKFENLEKAAGAFSYLDKLETLKADFTREEQLVENVRKFYKFRDAPMMKEVFPEIQKICQDAIEREIERIKEGVAEL